MYGRIFFLVFVLLCLQALPASATNTAPKSLGSFGAWQTYSYSENEQPVCYMVQTLTFVRKKKDKHARGSARLIITQRPAENSLDVISYTSGYNFKPASDVKITIDKSNFNLFTTQDSAWSRDARTDRAIATAMRSGNAMLISGLPAGKGASVLTDVFTLKDTAAAYHAIGKACGLATDTPKPTTKTKKKHT